MADVAVMADLGQTIFGQPISRGFGAAGVSHDSPRTPNVSTFEGPGTSNTKIPRRKKENCGGIFGASTSPTTPSEPHFFRVLAPP